MTVHMPGGCTSDWATIPVKPIPRKLILWCISFSLRGWEDKRVYGPSKLFHLFWVLFWAKSKDHYEKKTKNTTYHLHLLYIYIYIQYFRSFPSQTSHYDFQKPLNLSQKCWYSFSVIFRTTSLQVYYLPTQIFQAGSWDCQIYTASGAQAIQRLFKIWYWVDLNLLYSKINLVLLNHFVWENGKILDFKETMIKVHEQFWSQHILYFWHYIHGTNSLLREYSMMTNM